MLNEPQPKEPFTPVREEGNSRQFAVAVSSYSRILTQRK